MTRSLLLLVVCVLSACASPDPDLAVRVAGGENATPDPSIARDAIVAKAYDAAKRRDRSTLLAMRDDPAATNARDPAVALGLAIVDPKTYAYGFVADYPHDPDGVQNDYRMRLDRAHAVRGGAVYPITLLTQQADGGNIAAVVQLVRAYPRAIGDDGLTALYARSIREVTHKQPPVLLTALAAIAPADRLAVLGTVPWCAADAKTLATLTPKTDAERSVQRLLTESPTAPCASVARATARHRPPHTRLGRPQAPQARSHQSGGR
jgi:hypothetical protein